MIVVDGISKSYGGQELFKNASCAIGSGERVGLVGRNGSGKTTLFRLIAGEEEPDSGSIALPRNYSIGYVTQEPDFAAETVLLEGCRGLPEAERDHRWKVEKILAGLGFSERDFEKSPSELSGGFQVRLNLAKTLVREVDLLLLDEPNNYLDITSIRWLAQHLRSWRGELMLITHDRGFMDTVATHVVGIHRKSFRKIAGDTGKLYARLAADEETYERTRISDEKKRKQAEIFIRRFRAKAPLARRVQSRIKALERHEKLEKLEQEKNLDFSFRSKPSNGKPVMHARGISFAYEPESPLFSDLSFSVGPYDRLCVVGPNGKGKTTLLRALAGQLAPLSGEIVQNATAAVGYYAQANVGTLDDERTVLDEIYHADPAIDQQQARNICGMMMFEGDAALKKIKVLSGGEKNRVLLGTIIATPVNLLLLDEPTNHLDMESCDALLEAIDAFEGAVVMVTHNEMLLHGLAERLVVFQGGGASVFEGSYQRFLEDRGWDEERDSGESAAEEAPARRRADRKETRRLRAGLVRERAEALRPLEKRIAGLEGRIAAAEASLERLYAELEAASLACDSAAIAQVSIEIHGAQREIETCFEALETASGEHAETKTSFDRRLKDLDAEAGAED
ncbi:MAG: ATP-binding cassette domain-containing protein [Candidatus Latescibacterota bacterium]|jgi:ATP-binding cassette subfamily F protein 3|nr:MAG: ATP-binding cassette domain-containing protein [Candidatus Latescibacterota bacterium]